MPAMVEYIQKNSFFHKLNPMTKILWTFAIIILSFLTNEPLFILLVLSSNLLLAAASGILSRVLPIVRALCVFALFLVVFQIFFVDEGTTLLYILPFAQVGKVTDVGLNLSLVMALRMLATVSTIPMLIMTTPMTDIAVVMVEKMKVPFKYAFIFITTLRFIPTFMNEMEQILQSQMSRGYHSDTKNPFKKLLIIIPLAVPLLVSSIKKTEKMAISMEVRGFGSGPRSHYREINMKNADFAVIGIFIIAIVSSILYFYI